MKKVYGKGTYFLQLGKPEGGWDKHLFLDDYMHAGCEHVMELEANSWIDARSKVI